MSIISRFSRIAGPASTPFTSSSVYGLAGLLVLVTNGVPQ